MRFRRGRQEPPYNQITRARNAKMITMLKVLGWLVLLLPVAGSAQEFTVTSFEDGSQLSILRPRNTRIQIVEEGVTDGRNALRIEFDTVAWPALLFIPQSPFDLRAYGEIALDVTNPMTEPILFRVRVDDDVRANGTLYCRTGGATIQPGETRTFSFPLQAGGSALLGMKGLPAWRDAVSLGSSGWWTLDISHIVAFQIFLASPADVKTLIIDNVRFRPAPPLDGMVDAYGQYAFDEWPGKIHGVEELEERRETEREELDSFEPPADLDRFGGWADGPRLEATGYFRVEKYDEKWWLVTPDGTLFFSVGPDGVTPSEYTFVTGREYMFGWLPGEEEQLHAYISHVTGAREGPIREGTAVNFRGMNLERKYGPEPFEAWAETWFRRLRSWGFNTLGNWSDPRLFRRDMPYVIASHIWGPHNRLTTNVPSAGATIHDPFDPRFATSVRNVLQQQAQAVAGDPFCLGWFVDNEISWGNRDNDRNRYAVATAALAQLYASSPAKRAFVQLLQSRYEDLAALNTAWETNATSWETIAAPAALNDQVRSDYSAFVKEHARAYFSTVRRELKTLDPDHLYLGSRFAWYTPEAVEACAEFCDVLSFNVYRRSIVPDSWRFLEALDRPAIIGEFHFGALDRGMFHTGLVAAADQEDRGRLYQEYVRSVAAHPNFVGCHWFIAGDQPLTGRTLDGENYNIGLVTITDTPYTELTTAAREVHSEIYTNRGSAQLPRNEPRE